MRLLVTRPSEQAARTAQKLMALGHQPLLAPVVEIAPTGAALPHKSFDLLLATSARSFLGLQPTHPLLKLPLACVGPKTAEAGQALGFSILCVGADSEALADLLLPENKAKSALYLAGSERKGILERRLGEKAWRVEIVETYAARPVAAWSETIQAALERGEIDAVLHYSPRSAALGLALMGRESARALLHFCLSPEIASICRDWAPAEHIAAASQPDEDSLMTLLRSWSSGLGEQQA
jgi:uroporphyrinogen-III synthase